MSTVFMEQNSIRVALVDDHAIFRAGLRSLLARITELRVDIVFDCANGQQALNELDGCEVDLILMDMQMPVLDGVSATRSVCHSYPQTKVVALSSFGELSAVVDMVHAGASGYLMKDVAGPELALAIREVMAGKVYFTPQVYRILAGEGRTHAIPADALLTSREEEILRLICQGKTSKEIGEQLFISKRTVDGHRERIMFKTGARHLIELFLYAIRHHMYQPG
ncbi:MAG: response regulator transcription factor [Sphingobacteriales bacterium]|nr:MAG: response regulator transcription factor [Sphingobacteriales bacterium]